MDSNNQQPLPYYLREMKFKCYVATRVFEDMWDEEIDIDDVPRILVEIANDIATEIKKIP